MTREMILTRIANGESVSAEEVAQLRNFEELEALNREAARRQQEQTAQRQAQESRTALVNELIALDKAAESAARYFNDIAERRQKETRKLDQQEIDVRGEWQTAFITFDRKFRELSGLRTTDSHQPKVQEVFGELKRKGAKIEKVVEKISDLPLSPSIQMLLRESAQNASANIDS